MAEVTVRALSEDEWPTYKKLRLESLQSDPDAFVARATEEEGYDDERWRSRIRRSRRLVATRESADIGVASIGEARSEESAEEGVAELFGMWVRPEARGTGVAWALVSAAADHARQMGHQHLQLWVWSDNGRAIGFYSSFGFRPTDERRPMTNHPEVEEVAMALPLT